MKKLFVLLMLMSMIAIFAQEIFITNTISQTLSKVNVQDFTADNSFAQIGLYANQVIYHDDYVYVVNSGDNNIQVIPTSGGRPKGPIYLENSSNPYSIKIHNNYIYVTGLFTGKLYKIALDNYDDITELYLGESPQEMLIDGNIMYIVLTGFQNPNYGQGQVCIVDITTFAVEGYIHTDTNPQDLFIAENGYLHVICTGNYAATFSSVNIIDSQNHESITTITLPPVSFFSTIQLGNDGLVYVGNALGLGFLTYDPQTYEIINQVGSFKFPPGDRLFYDETYLYVLKPSYFLPSELSIYTLEHEHVQTLTLGIGANSMAYKPKKVSDKDETISPQISFFAYPNPFINEITLSVWTGLPPSMRGDIGGSNMSPEPRTHIDIYNAKGQKIKTLQGLNTTWNGKDKYGHQAPNGVYFAKVSSGNDTAVKKIMLLK